MIFWRYGVPTLTEVYNSFARPVNLQTFIGVADYDDPVFLERVADGLKTSPPIVDSGLTTISKEDKALQADMRIIQTEGIGDCGPCALAQALLVEGVLQNRKEFVVDFILDIFQKNKEELMLIDLQYDNEYRINGRGDFDVDKEELQFTKFISIYLDETMLKGESKEDGAAKFITRFMRPYNVETGEPDINYRFVKLIGLLLRLECKKHSLNNGFISDDGDDIQQFLPTNHMNLELMFGYLASKGIKLNLFRNKVEQKESRVYSMNSAIKGQQLVVDVMLSGRNEGGNHYETIMRGHRVDVAVRNLKSSREAPILEARPSTKPKSLAEELQEALLKTKAKAKAEAEAKVETKSSAPLWPPAPPVRPKAELPTTKATITTRRPPPPPPAQKTFPQIDLSEYGKAKKNGFRASVDTIEVAGKQLSELQLKLQKRREKEEADAKAKDTKPKSF